MKNQLSKIKWIIVLEILFLISIMVVIIYKQNKSKIVSPPMDFWQSRYVVCDDGRWHCDSTNFLEDTIEPGNYVDFIYGPYMSIPAGDYIVGISYKCDSDQLMYVHDYNNGRYIWGQKLVLKSEKTEGTLKVLLTRPMEQLEVRVGYNGVGNLDIESIVVSNAETSLKILLLVLAVVFIVGDLVYLFFPYIKKYVYVLSNGRGKNRIPYYDLIRFLSAVWIFTGHYWEWISPGKLPSVMNSFPQGIILGGVSGKLAAAMIAVIMGYFSSVAGETKKKTYLYVIERYIYFFVLCLITNTIYYFAHINYGYDEVFSGNYFQVIIFSLTMNAKIIGVLWSMLSFYFGSIICFVNSKIKAPIWVGLIEIIILFSFNTDLTFSAVCICGFVMHRLFNMGMVKEIFSRKLVRIFAFLACITIIKCPESNLSYLVDGISSTLLLVIINYSKNLSDILNNISIKLGGVGQKYMGIYILHVLAYKTVIEYFPLLRLNVTNDTVCNWLLYFVSLIFTIILSYPVEWTILRVAKLINKHIEKMDAVIINGNR